MKNIKNITIVRYLPTDEHWNTVFTNIAPYCLTREEAERLLNEWHGPYGADDGMEFDELWREASADEIVEYGIGENS